MGRLGRSRGGGASWRVFLTIRSIGLCGLRIGGGVV